MSQLLNGIRSHLAEARQEHERVLNKIQKLEELESLAVELDELDDAEPQPSTGEGRRGSAAGGAPPAAARARVEARRPSESTAKRPPAVNPDDIVENVKGAMKRLGPASPNAIGLHLGYQKSTSGMVAVRACIANLLAAGDVRVDGQVRGRPAYSLTTGNGSASKHPLDQLVDRIVEQLEIDGRRVARTDLKARVGNPDPEDFNLAVDRALNLKKITRVSTGGVTGYELVRK